MRITCSRSSAEFIIFNATFLVLCDFDKQKSSFLCDSDTKLLVFNAKIIIFALRRVSHIGLPGKKKHSIPATSVLKNISTSVAKQAQNSREKVEKQSKNSRKTVEKQLRSIESRTEQPDKV